MQGRLGASTGGQIRRAVAIVKAQVEYMSFPQRLKLAANIVFKKKFGTEKEL